ncbi:thiamine kinase [Candidatus Photodesmus katoptron]|uniref:Thiamine kinase n=1 Tax=Candidatus Photodesmus katoptron Akat1 TaxID=1236703 RepID=S3E0W4_9GAMM|nr:phosphotransferase [Candidatus Photodesmus katoptron]EPE37781.1 hypothetical protein O1U_0243 [Candidatus Photodesmus katoptron Akat1]KEY90498.1 thiamine kinase [Candidatus Photodesmus katoptron]
MSKILWKKACQLNSSLLTIKRLFKKSPSYVQILSEGLTNYCYKVVFSNGNKYVWRFKIPAVKKAFLISQFQEFQVLSFIQSTLIAPKPIIVNSQGILVDWIEGDSLRVIKTSFNSVLKIIVKIHELNIDNIHIPRFNFIEKVDHYWSQIRNELKTHKYQKLYNHWRNIPNLPSINNTLCHFDLTTYNMVNTILGNKVIDWEYATISDPRLDLALSINAANEEVFKSVSYYCKLRKIVKTNDWIAGVLLWKPRAIMMVMLWYLLNYQIWNNLKHLSEAEKLKDYLIDYY